MAIQNYQPMPELRGEVLKFFMLLRRKKLIFSVTVLLRGLQVEMFMKLKCLHAVVLAQITRSAGMTAVSRLHHHVFIN